MIHTLRFPPILVLALLCLAAPAAGERLTFKPASDLNDGQLVDQTTWDARLQSTTLADLFLTCGRVSGTRYDLSLGYTLAGLSEGQILEDVRLRLNEQGGSVGASLVLRISAALALDPLEVPGAARFALPRTTQFVLWNVPADADSSGQRVAKYQETPDVSPVLNEVLSQSGWDASTKGAVFFVEVESPLSGSAFLRTDDTHGPFIGGGNAGIPPIRLVVCETLHDTFWGKEMLCRPTPGSVEVNVVPRFATEAYCEWGTDSFALSNTTPIQSITAETAYEFTLDSLPLDTTIHYRLRFRRAGDVTFLTGPTHSFVSLPAPLVSQTTRICVTTDIHVTNLTALGLNADLALLEQSLDTMLDFEPLGWHLWMDLGDLVVVRALRVAFDAEEVEQRYRDAREDIDRVAHSIPFIFVRGNHEEVNGWDADGTPNNTTIWSGTMLLKYFPPPLPDAFYSGNTTPFPHLGLPGNYFAFNAGPLRVRCLDPYLFSTTRPHNGHGEIGGSLNGWDWRLGNAQYDWLVDDLMSHHAPYSLTALHHLSSCYTGTGEFYGRGGIEIAKHEVDGRPSFEWGGEDSNGNDILAAQRPGFTQGSVHDVLVGEGNQVVMKGHDHFHARQSLDGMTYLTLAKPDDTGAQTGNLWGWRFFSYYPEPLTIFQPNSGFLSIVAGPDEATYSYVQTYPAAGQGTILDSFTVLPAQATGVNDTAQPAVLRTAIDDAFPNPTRSGSALRFQIARSGPARLVVVDASGRLVRVVAQGPFEAGSHDATWDGFDEQGSRVAAGVYFAKLESVEGRAASVKMIVIR